MPDNNTMQSPIEFAAGFDPFSDDAPQVQAQIKAEESPVLEENQSNNDAAAQADENQNNQSSSEQQQNTFNPDDFIRENFGFNSLDEAKEEIKRIKEQPKEPQFDFKDEISKTLFDAIREGKSDEVYDILNQQKKIDKLVNSEINPILAEDIIKTNIQNKYKDLTSEEVDLLFFENYSFPPKPEQGYDETEDEYNQKLKTWQSQVDYVERKMIIDAKVIRPELAKLKSELKLPDIYGLEQLQMQSQQESENAAKARTIYENTLNSQFNSFNGFSVSVKDEEVEIPITFNVGEDERLNMKEDLMDFDSDTYFGDRWFNEDGTPKVNQIMSDKYLLENYPKILQKVANEAASQRLLSHLKKSGNININQSSPQGKPQENPNANMDALANWAFSA